MKRTALAAACVAALLPRAGAAEPANAQDQQALALAREVQAQQLAIADNQAKIEAKLATIAEAVRVARIYASRSGAAKPQ